MIRPSDVRIEDLIELMKNPEAASRLVEAEVTQLGHTPENYMDIALRVANALLQTPSGPSSLDEVKEWVLRGQDFEQSATRMCVVVTALESLQTHTTFPGKTEEIGIMLEQAAVNRHDMFLLSREGTIASRAFPPTQRMILEEQGWEVLGG